MLLQGNNPYTQPSYSLQNRMMRLAWNVTHAMLFKWSPRPLHAWRATLLRVFGATIGAHCHVYPGAKVWAPWNLRLGNYVGIGDGVTVYCMDRVEIGDYSVISQGTYLCGGTHDYNSSNFQLISKPIVIADHVWIAAEAFVHPGVVIPSGCVIGARAVVIKSLPSEWTVYAGHPCQAIGVRRKRFPVSEETVKS